MKAADMFILSGIASTNGRGVSTQGEPLHKLIENSLTFDKKCELAYKYSQEFSGTEDVDYQAENIQTFKKLLSNLIEELDETFIDLKAMLEGMINYSEKYDKKLGEKYGASACDELFGITAS